MSDGPILAAEGVERRYATGRRVLEVLRGVDLEVREGEALAITGMSGAGKSTLLHILGGLDRPDAGRVAFAERDWYAMGERERGRVRAKQVGFVFQAYHLLPEMSVLENVMLAGMNQPGAVWRGRALRMTHRPNELSGGEQQRVALARALVNHPSMLLADEPTGNLDSKTGEDVLACLFDLRKREGLTLVMVTHNEDIAERCGRRIRMRDGRIEGGEQGGEMDAFPR